MRHLGYTRVREGEPVSAAVRNNVRALIQELDEEAWHIQDSLAEGDSEEDYARAFCEARAVNAVLYALDEPSFEATLECAYETQAARDDLPGLRRTIKLALA